MNAFVLLSGLGVLISALPSAAVAQVCEGDITLTTQAQVDAFQCEEVTGTLWIENISDLKNLDGLSALAGVGSLSICGNPALTNLNGLSALGSIGGELEIRSNTALTNLDGLSALISVGGDFDLLANATLTDVDGLMLTSVGGELWISGNPLLSNLDGMSALTSVGNNLWIYDNALLSRCTCGLFSLIDGGAVSGQIMIQDNATGCNSIEEVPQGTCGSVANDQDESLPAELALAAPYPNPFNPSTAIRYSVPVPGQVRLAVYDVLGRLVSILVDQSAPQGHAQAVFQAEGLPTGLYVVRLEQGRAVRSRWIVLAR